MKAFKYHESLLVVLQMEGENYTRLGKEYIRPCQMFVMVFFCKNSQGFNSLTVFAKSYLMNV